MAGIKELIREEKNGTISFGNYEVKEKSKVNDFKHDGDIYYVKTHDEVTKLEKNGSFVYESVPGTAVTDFDEKGGKVTFSVEGFEDSEITLGLEPETDYDIKVNGADAGTMKTNLGGKLTLSVEIDPGKKVKVEVTKS